MLALYEQACYLRRFDYLGTKDFLEGGVPLYQNRAIFSMRHLVSGASPPMMHLSGSEMPRMQPLKGTQDS